MQNPFPGMNPYLEQAELWHQVHNRLIVAIADALTPQIAPQYRVSIEERIYTCVDEILLVGIADVAVASSGSTGNRATLTSEKLAEPYKVRVPMPEEVIERYLEVRLTQNNQVITAIEILSPKNKRSKEGRIAYENKRQKILGSSTHLVEIDLLRQGDPMPILDSGRADYQILVSRSHCRPDAYLYLFDLEQPIPQLPIPLRAGEPEPTIDLQQLIDEVYKRARFDLAIDYSQPVKPALSPEKAAWVRAILERSSLDRNN
jgi:hypothetical protein